MASDIEERFRSGVGYWHFTCDPNPGDTPGQVDLAVAVDCGVWRLPAVDASVGASTYTQWAAGPRHYDDVKVRFLMNEQSKGLHTFAHDVGIGKNQQNRFAFSLHFHDNVDNKTDFFRIEYTNASIVAHRNLGYVSTAHGEALEEEITFRANEAKITK